MEDKASKTKDVGAIAAHCTRSILGGHNYVKKCRGLLQQDLTARPQLCEHNLPGRGRI